MAFKTLDGNIKETIARVVSEVYAIAEKMSYKEVYRFVKYNMKTDKGVRSMINLGFQCCKKIKSSKIEEYVFKLKLCEDLYFAERRG